MSKQMSGKLLRKGFVAYSKFLLHIGLCCVLAWSSAINAEVEQVCIDRFMANDAIPGAENCPAQALASPAGLSNFACTGPAGDEIIAEYCGLVDDGRCDFAPIDFPSGSLENIDRAEILFIGALESLFASRYSSLIGESFLVPGEDVIGLFTLIIGLESGLLLQTDFTGQFRDLDEFNALVDNLDNCP